jgi:hypothetical protein
MKIKNVKVKNNIYMPRYIVRVIHKMFEKKERKEKEDKRITL